MSRIARCNNLSDSKTYHIILKGINSQEIFLEDGDRAKFLKLLEDAKEIFEFDIYAYVLMGNHIHLIIYDKENNISQIMHRVCAIYAIYFNKKYERIGHLFQNRFKNKCVNTENYLLNLQRYIHRNPEKEGIEKTEYYKWSSYQEYVLKKKIVNIDFILNFFDTNKEEAVKKFIKYNKVDDNNSFNIMEFELKSRLTDEEAIVQIKESLNINNIMLIQNFKKEKRDQYINEISNIKGISNKQMSRILGISDRTIQRAITGK